MACLASAEKDWKLESPRRSGDACAPASNPCQRQAQGLPMACVPDTLRNPAVSSKSLPRPVQLIKATSLTRQTDDVPPTAPLNPPPLRPHILSLPEKSTQGSGMHDVWSKAISSLAWDHAMQPKATRGRTQTKAGVSCGEVSGISESRKSSIAGPYLTAMKSLHQEQSPACLTEE